MDRMIDHGKQAERDAPRMQANREELVERIARAVPEDGSAQPLEGLHLYRISLPLGQVHSVVKPSFCVIAQGSKEILLGDSRYRYDPSHYLITTVELPRVSQTPGCIAGAALPRSPPGTRPRPGGLGHGGGRSHVASSARRITRQCDARDRCQPVGCEPAGRRRAAGPAVGFPGRRAGADAADHAGDHLPAPDGAARRPAPSPGGHGRLHLLHRPEPSSGSARTLTSRCASRILRASWV